MMIVCNYYQLFRQNGKVDNATLGKDKLIRKNVVLPQEEVDKINKSYQDCLKWYEEDKEATVKWREENQLGQDIRKEEKEKLALLKSENVLSIVQESITKMKGGQDVDK